VIEKGDRHFLNVMGNSPQLGTHHVLEHNSSNQCYISIGDHMFLFKYTNYFRGPFFANKLQQILNTTGDSEPIDEYLLPSSVGDPIQIKDYNCSQHAFADRSSATLYMGWTRSGTPVVAKRFKRLMKVEMSRHRKTMESLGSHVWKWKHLSFMCRSNNFT
jgi:hypothetical protein